MTTDEWRRTRGWDHYCFYCFRTAVGPVPDEWEVVFSQAVCPTCWGRAEGDGGIEVVRAGAYAEGRPDPAATNPKYA